ncbi:MAG: hypothetical protein KDA79_20880, partial [Planctomycetaceae bacterium]|nr:hypothetical protein [Planctomycetaceae bacterium]
MLLTLATACRAEDKPVRVFVLAGQSNMEGKATVSLLEHQLTDPKTAGQFAHLRPDGKWLERDDVLIRFLDRHGKLTVGYGSPGRIGPELGFGLTVGDRFEEPVLLIKTAWGGRSLYRDFRPPSAGLPSDETLDQLLEQARKRKPDTTREDIVASFGRDYRLMLENIRDTLNRRDELFPGLKGRKTELAGFVWFQGWNDMINADYTAEYASNMAHFIRDVRRDLKVPQLPFVIGQLGVDGVDGKPNPKRDAFKAAQAEPAQLPEFSGNVALVKTDQFWDTEAHAIFLKGWKKHFAEWEKVGSDYPFHYLGSVKTYYGIGTGFGKAMLELIDGKEEPTTFFDPIDRNVEGWTVRVDPALLEGEYREEGELALKALANHLQRITWIVPEQQLAELRKLPIWLEREHPTLGNMQYHPARGWLVAHGHDPRLAKHVHIPRAADLTSRRTWAKHPYVVLHELAHAWHDQGPGFDDPKIKAAWEQAAADGIYEEVLLHTGKKVRHYGLTNQMEYFAESTEAYLGVNDFYPFVRAELAEHDPRMYALLAE